MLRTISHALAASFFLVGQPVSAAPIVAVDSPVDTIVVLDVSGSMNWDLPEFKRAVSNMLPRILRPGDTFSLIYFSGPGQCAILVDQMGVRAGGNALADITAIQATLANLETIGLTCFVDPLNLLAGFGAKMKAARPNSRRAAFFGSDGYDNTSPGGSASARRGAIMAAVSRAVGDIDRWTTCGVGYGCDQGMLQEMAAVGGGTFLFAADVTTYARDFETSAGKRPDGARRKRVAIEGTPVDGVVFTVGTDGSISQYAVADGHASIAENAGTIWYVSASQVGGSGGGMLRTLAKADGGDVVTAAYAAVVLFAQRCRRKVVRALTFGLGDARFVSLAGACFGPQRYNAFADIALEAVHGTGRFTDGDLDGAAEPNPNAYTVLEAIAALRGGDNRIVPGFEGWKYTPITRARVAAAGVVTDDDVKQVGELVAAVAPGADATALEALADAIRALKDAKGTGLKWTYLPALNGYRVDGVVIASEEANVSLRIKRPISLDLGPALDKLDAATRAKLPATIESFRYSMFTVITGRVLNAPTLPVILDASTWETFRRAGLVDGPHRSTPVLLNFGRLPMINDSMIDGLRGANVVRVAYELEQVKAALKPLNEIKRLLPREAGGVAAWIAAAGCTGDEAAAVITWLEDLGITDGGFSPASTAAMKTGDNRRSWKLDIGIPGLSSLPSLDKVREKLAKIDAWEATPKGKAPKLTKGEALVAPGVREVDTFLKANGLVLDAAKLDAAGFVLLDGFVKQAMGTLETRRADLLFRLGQAAITAICGGEWFADLVPGETTVTLVLGGEETPCAIDICDVEIAL